VRRRPGSREIEVGNNLTSEVEALLGALPEEIRGQLPDTRGIRPRPAAVAGCDRSAAPDGVTQLRLRLLDRDLEQLVDLDARENEAADVVARLTAAAGSPLGELCGIAGRSDAELLVDVGDRRRFAGEDGFARFDGTPPLRRPRQKDTASTAVTAFNRPGNRRVNAVLHRMAVTQLRCEPRARAIYDNARARGHPKKRKPCASSSDASASRLPPHARRPGKKRSSRAAHGAAR
jgi:transposase